MCYLFKDLLQKITQQKIIETLFHTIIYQIFEISNNNDYTTGNLLDFAYFKENYRLVAIDLSKQTKLKDPQQINFIGKLENNHGATMFFINEKSDETTLNFSQNSGTII